jgi:PAS domain S-box-containing protein
MQEPAIPSDELQRLAGLYALNILDTPPEERYNRIVRLAARIFKVPIALISLVDKERQWFKACVGLDVTETSRRISFCGHAINSKELLIVEDALLDPRFDDNPLVTGEPFVRFYAGYPLTGRDGYRLGTLCLIDRTPRSFTPEELESLLDLGRMVEDELFVGDLTIILEEKLKNEEALLYNQHLMDGINRALPLLVYLFDVVENRNIYSNSTIEAMLGYTQEMLADIGDGILKKLTHPDDYSKVTSAFVALAKSRPGEIVETEYRFLAANGEYRWLLSRDQVFKRAEDGKILQVLGISQDITERKRIEQALIEEHEFALRVMNTMGQGLTVTNEKGQFEYVNPAYASMLGCEPADLIGQSPLEYTVDEDKHTLIDAWKKRQELKTFSYETRLRKADGGEVYALITGAPRLRNGEMIGSVAVITDLTERRQLEEAMRESRDKALEVSRIKSEFLATVSHEIRTPLNGIIGMSDFLVEMDLDKEQMECASIIRDSGYALLTILNDILDLSKIEAGKLILDEVPFDVSSVIENAADLMASQAAARGLSILTYLSPGIPGRLLGDAGRLRQVLLNLLGNALKFTPQGEILVQVLVQEFGENHCQLKFNVRDKGVGIPKEAFATVHFYNQSKEKGIKATGIGIE